jgi:hypothetical protein
MLPRGKTKTYSNLVLVGPKSANNRVYDPEVLRRAVADGLYDGVPIFLDHEEKIQTLVGRVVKAYWDEDKSCVRGDIEIYDSPYSSIIDVIINVFGGEFGFSHVVEADVDEDKESGKEHVKWISKVKSVDLVTDPATTRGINEVQERVMNAIRSVIKESRKKRLKECGDNTSVDPTGNTGVDSVVDNLIQSYYNGEISLFALVRLLETISQGKLKEKVQRKECCKECEGDNMPRKKLKEQESDFAKDEKIDNKDKEVVDNEETKEQEEDKEKEDETLEEDSQLEDDGEDMDTDKEEEDKEVEEEDVSEEDVSEEDEEHEDGEDELEEEEEENEDSEDMEEDVEEDVEEDEDEDVEEDVEECKESDEDKELKESKKRKHYNAKRVKENRKVKDSKKIKESVLSLKRELNTARRKLRESQKLLEEIVKSKYVPSAREYKIISESKDPVGLIKILSEKRLAVPKSKPKTISESRKTQERDEWDQMIEEVRRRKGLIR